MGKLRSCDQTEAEQWSWSGVGARVSGVHVLALHAPRVKYPARSTSGTAWGQWYGGPVV